MKSKFLTILLSVISLFTHAQITENPFVESQKTNLINISRVYTNALLTIVDIDLQQFFLQKALLNGWVSMSSETSIQYKDPTTGEIVSIKAIVIQKWINSQSKFQDAHFDTKYEFLDFGNSQIWALFRLIFPPIASGVNNISISENAGRRGFYWNNVKIETVNSVTNFEEAKKNIEEHISKTKSIYAGEYEGVEAAWELAFLQEDNNFVLVNTDATQPGWNIGDIWADLKATAYPNVFLGTRYISESTEHKITVTFENGIMTIKDGNDVQQYVKIKGNGTESDEPSLSSKWSGTGFALKNGYVVTNYHVAGNAKSIEIFGVNGNFEKSYKADIVGVDKVSDLALLKISDKNIAKTINPPYSFYPSMVEVGENIYVLGYPLTQSMGDEIKLTNGIVSSRSGYEGDVTLYQISAPIQPGNSGGPMFDMKGRLVGVVCARHTGAENASYAIKTSYLKNLIESVSSAAILPTSTVPMSKELKDQVKKVKDFVYMIKCSN